MKLLLKILLLLAAIAYLAYAFFHLNGEESNSVCREVNIEITDSAQAGFITRAEVEQTLRAAKLYPLGRKMAEINGQRIEDRLTQNPFIRSVVCYKSGTRVNLTLAQRLPVMRVLADNGDDYYLDSAGRVMPRMHYAADLVVATGHITPDYARRYLVRLGRYLQADPFWNDQIEQLHVDAAGNMEFVPRVGNHVVSVGRPVGMYAKLRRLRAFYEQVAGEVGWNKYSRINLAYDNQLICTKQE